MKDNNKLQHMTSLNGDVMVRKDDPRIHFRGLLDGAMADTGFGAALALYEGNVRLSEALGDVNRCLMAIMSAHVRCCEPELPYVAGRDMESLHEMSHNPQKYFKCGHFIPSPEDGLSLSWLNVIRTRVRDVERSLISAYNGEPDEKLCRAVNRVSSAVYVLMCEENSIRKG